ncbi:MAG: hypothetical protein LBP98_07025 [Tannerella sp.]|nr:hypothetical protein [Tannerella sp.]
MPSIWVKNALRNAVEAASGGKVTVLFDDKDNPSYMVRFPSMTNKDLYRQYFEDDNAWNASPFKAIENEVHPAFKKDGTQIRELLIGQYAASDLDGRACALPGVDPRTVLSYDASLSRCKNKGTGWTLNTIWNWGFIQALCLCRKYQPRGNTNYGRSHELAWETALRVDGGVAGNTEGTPRTKTGTGPVSWSHDGTESGVYDLVGNIWEWVTGMKLVDGKILLAPDNNVDLAESGWLDTGAKFDSTGGTSDGEGNGEGTGDIGDPVLSDEITKYTGVPGSNTYDKEAYIGGEAGFRSLTKKPGFTIPVALVQAGLAPVTLVGGSYETGAALKGAIWVRNYGERLPLVGGNWHSGAAAGLGALHLGGPRSYTDSNIGLRPAFLLV